MSTEARGQGVFGATPGARAWGAAHPAGLAAAQGLLFAILLGVALFLTVPNPLGFTVALAVGAGVLFGLGMGAVSAVRRRRADRP